MNRTSRARWMLIASMVTFGTIGIFRRYIPIGSATLAMLRGFLGTLFLLVVMAVTKQRPDKTAIRQNGWKLILSGGMIGINWILLFEAYNHTTVAIATLCYYMAPILVILVSPMLLKEKLTVKKGICAVIALVGMVLVSGVVGSHGADLTGVMLGLGAAAFYAAVVLTNKTIRGVAAYDKTVMQLGSAAAVIAPYVFLTEKTNFAQLSGISLCMILIVCIVHTGIAYALYFGAIEHLPAQTAALYSYIDPIVAVILSAVLLAEKMDIFGTIGAVLVLGSTIVSEWEPGENNRTN